MSISLGKFVEFLGFNATGIFYNSRNYSIIYTHKEIIDLRMHLSWLLHPQPRTSETNLTKEQQKTILLALESIKDEETYCYHCKEVIDIFDDCGSWPDAVDEKPSCLKCLDKIGWRDCGER